MAKKKPDITIESYGIYRGYDKTSKDVPDIEKFTLQIPVIEGTEFGYILRIKNAKNSKIDFIMEHPPFKDDNGNVRPSFTGEQYVKTNDYKFFLGDNIWLPESDKRGRWRLITKLDKKVIADKIFEMF